MKRRAGLPTLTEAVDWLASVWEDRDTPTRLHKAEHDGWGLMYAPAFARYLGATPYDLVQVSTDPERPSAMTNTEYAAPLWRALDILHRRNRGAYDTVLTLVINGYSVRGCAQLGYGEGALLTAIRRLFDCYERAPVAYTEKSESQRMAEGMVA